MRYYKVVCLAKEGLFSQSMAWPYCCASWPGKGVVIRYRKGRWTRPEIKGSKLLCYDSLYTACCNAAWPSGFQVWRCEVVNPVKDEKMSPYMDDVSIRYFWARKAGRVSKSLEARFRKAHPEGMFDCGSARMVHADAIKLVSEVKRRPKVPF